MSPTVGLAIADRLWGFVAPKRPPRQQHELHTFADSCKVTLRQQQAVPSVRRREQHVTTLQESPPALAAYKFLPLTTTSLGTTLHVDLDNEDCWMEVAPEHSELALAFVHSRIEALGLEIMDDDECAPTVDESGNVRYYLAERL